MRIGLNAISFARRWTDKHLRLCACSDAGRRSACIFIFIFYFYFLRDTILGSPGVVTQFALVNSFAIHLQVFKPGPSSPCCHVYLTDAAIALTGVR